MNTNKKMKIDKNNVVKILIPLIAIILFIYIIYKVTNLIIVPTDMVMVENGTIYNEESAVRIRNKR